DRFELDLDVAPWSVGDAPQSSAVARTEGLGVPAEARAQPAGEERRAGRRRRLMAHDEIRDPIERGPSLRRIKRSGETLAPGRGPQPREVDDVRRAQQFTGPGEGFRRIRQIVRIEQDHIYEV